MSTESNPAAGFVARIHAQFHAELWRFLVRRLRGEQDAADLAQEVYLRLLRLDKSELVREPQAYVYTIASHVAHQFRMRSRQSAITFDSEIVDRLSTDPEQAHPDELMERLNAQRQVERILETLPATHCAVLVLFKRDGFSYEEIAAKLGLSVHTVKKYLYEAKARLLTTAWRES